MQNAEGQTVDLYIPRKCSWTNRILAANDFGSVQVNVGNVDPETGLFTKTSHPIAICGFSRSRGEGDHAITTLVRQHDAEGH